MLVPDPRLINYCGPRSNRRNCCDSDIAITTEPHEYTMASSSC
jgi:hypothetical protein